MNGSTRVGDAARQFGFVNPNTGKTVDDLRQDLPLFIVRAGQDRMPGLNETLDGFLVRAVERNLPVTFVNYPAGAHAFDLFDESATAREIVRQILGFLQFHLAAS
jgi:acetyl esterase/lipase